MEEKKITFEDIQKANKTIKLTDIKGKDYAEVNQRIKAFRMVYPQGTITTELMSCENGVCMFKAVVTNEIGTVLATGTAYEKENGSFINKTSYIENCETSAVGRALGMAGFGVDTSLASADEVLNAISNQEKVKKTSTSVKQTSVDYRNKLIEYCKKANMDMKEVAKKYSLNGTSGNEDFKKVLAQIVKEGQNASSNS